MSGVFLHKRELDAYIGGRVREFRMQRGGSADELARRVGIQAERLYALEAGNAVFSVVEIFSLADALDIEPTAFFDFQLSADDEKPKNPS